MNLLPNPLLTNVLDLMKIDSQNNVVSSGNLQNYGVKNGFDNSANDASTQNSTVNMGTPSLQSLLTSRNLSNHMMSNSTLPLGAQIFTIPASLATFPNSDLIPVFVNSLGQMVLANTGNLLANSLASLATTLTSLQQLSANRDQGLFANSQQGLQNNGILDHLMQQYQQMQMLKNPVLQQSWPDTFQAPQREQSPAFMVQPVQLTTPSNCRPDLPSDKTTATSLFSIPTSCSTNSLPSEKFIGTLNVPQTDYRTLDNKSPSASSSVSSRSVGNKINQMIDVTNDYILGQDDHLVKEKAAELMRQSYSQQSFNNNFNESKFMGTVGFNPMSNLDKSGDPITDSSQHSQSMTVDGVDIGEIREFARNFKIKRLSMGLTQTQVGQALTAAEGPAYSQSAICRFEKLDITPKSAQKIKPILEKWIKESEEKFRNGDNSVEEGSGSDINKKRKRRTSFTPQALEILNIHFDKKSHPTGTEMRTLANELNYDREVIRVWFCNKRQALKNSMKRVKPSPSNENNLVKVNCTPDMCVRQRSCDSVDNKDATSTRLDTEPMAIDLGFVKNESYNSEAEDLSIERYEGPGRKNAIEDPLTVIKCTD